jgi:GTP-binding protein Era
MSEAGTKGAQKGGGGAGVAPSETALDLSPQPEGGFRSGFVALVGRPNVGKSTLLNRILDRKVSIVSSKPQTTRNRVAGVLTRSDYQLILLDMPGFQKPRDLLTERMQRRVEGTLAEVEAVLFLLNGTEHFGRGDAFIASALERVNVPVVVAVNKADLLTAEQRAEQVSAAGRLGAFPRVHAVSALTGDGVAALVDDLVAWLPAGPQYFPSGAVSDQPEEFLVAEFIREKAVEMTEEEVPHAIAVQVLDMESREERDLLYIRAALYIERPSQRPILLGEGGARIKAIGTEARRDIELLLGTRVFLDLSVKVRRHWRADGRMLDRLGL